MVCEDTAHQAITHTVDGERRFEVIDDECVGCNLCVSICPVDSCITMKQTSDDNADKLNWTAHPNNPMRNTD